MHESPSQPSVARLLTWLCAVVSAAEYTPPDVDGTDADAELRRVNTIVEMLIEGKRQVKNHPPPVKLAPVKPPSREHPEPEQDVQWDEFLTGASSFSLAATCAMPDWLTEWRLCTGLDAYDEGQRKELGSGSSVSGSSRPSSRGTGGSRSRPGSRG
eukprot:COSAG04_NODE_243_length_18986_cov_22.038598_15_plen_156_part_00